MVKLSGTYVIVADVEAQEFSGPPGQEPEESLADVANQGGIQLSRVLQTGQGAGQQTHHHHGGTTERRVPHVRELVQGQCVILPVRDSFAIGRLRTRCKISKISNLHGILGDGEVQWRRAACIIVGLVF